jgi:hypothetical protein
VRLMPFSAFTGSNADVGIVEIFFCSRTLFICQLFLNDTFPGKGGVAGFCALRRTTAT